MTVYSKEKKTIHMDGTRFIYLVHERKDFVRLRIYPAWTKTSYADVYFTWKGYYSNNLFQPSVCAPILRYVINQGWRHQDEKQIWTIEQGDFLLMNQ